MKYGQEVLRKISPDVFRCYLEQLQKDADRSSVIVNRISDQHEGVVMEGGYCLPSFARFWYKLCNAARAYMYVCLINSVTSKSFIGT